MTVTEFDRSDYKRPCEEWHRSVQPEIDARPPTTPWSPFYPMFLLGLKTRADVGWDWRNWGNLVFSRPLRRRKPRLFTLATRDLVSKASVPLGMIALLEAERWVEDWNEPAVFVWFMSAAPERFLQQKLSRIPKSIGRATLDIAISVALDGPADGRLWLHADKTGGASLAQWYATGGMTCVPSRYRSLPPGAPFRRNDARYFWHTKVSALKASQSLDFLR